MVVSIWVCLKILTFKASWVKYGKMIINHWTWASVPEIFRYQAHRQNIKNGAKQLPKSHRDPLHQHFVDAFK